MKREAEKAQEEETVKTEPWFPEMSFTTVISVVGISLTAIDLFMRFNRKDTTPKVLSEPPQVDLPKPLQPSKIPVPKMGMI